jgi:hypothetical protein
MFQQRKQENSYSKAAESQKIMKNRVVIKFQKTNGAKPSPGN